MNLASQYGPIELEKRVHQAARTATDKAMVKARELVAAARQKLPQ
ncbi:MAG: hypothetical protein WA807_02415 [Steroidobacteraceae bacterium]